MEILFVVVPSIMITGLPSLHKNLRVSQLLFMESVAELVAARWGDRRPGL
ncbi:hypothetical protein [Streptomyces sp. NPDC050263]